MEAWLTDLWNTHVGTWGYAILFFWSILEGEIGLIFAGLASHDGHMNVFLLYLLQGLEGLWGISFIFILGDSISVL